MWRTGSARGATSEPPATGAPTPEGRPGENVWEDSLYGTRGRDGRAETSDPSTARGPAWLSDRLGYVLAAVAVIAAAVAVIEWQYGLAPVPPGVDPGDWLQRTYPLIGRAYPPAQAIGSPYLYPPFIFPFLAATVVATGNPLTAAFLFAGVLFAVYGLTALLLAWRALEKGTFRVAFVALSVLNGTVIAMMFWGAYPNLAGFILMDLSLFFLIGFLQTERAVYAAGIWIAAALTYLAHSLTFDLLLAALALSFLLVVAAGRFPRRWLANRGHLVGLAVLAGTVVAYTEVSRYLGIPHPDYYYANPAAYVIDNLGELFGPLGNSPAVTPPGSSVFLAPVVVFALLTAAGLVTLVVTALLARKRPPWVRPVGLVAAGWLAAVVLAPAGGYLVHIDTDYTRFLYFLPQPLALLALAAADRWVGDRSDVREPEVPPAPASDGAVRRRRLRPSGVLIHGALVLLICLLVVNVTIPVAQSNERVNTFAAHDPLFLAAIDYLNGNPRPGAVLTVQGATRWVEALTARAAYDPGPTWLLFENWQITNAEESYWALNCYTAATNNELVYSYSNLSSPLLSEAPLYSIYQLGVAVPILRVLPGASTLNLTVGGTPTQVTLSSLAAAGSTFAPDGTGAVVRFGAQGVQVQETVAFGGPSDSWLNLTLTPSPGESLDQATLALGPPPPLVSSLRAPPPPSVALAPGAFAWSVAAGLGQLPGNVNVTTNGTWSPAPSSVSEGGPGLPGTIQATFPNPAPTQPLSVGLRLSTPNTSNPGTDLPSLLPTNQFLADYDVHYLLLPQTPQYAQTIAFYQAELGFVPVFQNSEWILLSR